LEVSVPKIPALLPSVVVVATLFTYFGVCQAAEKPPAAPLAHFRFDGNGKDEKKGNPAFELKNTQFKDNALYLNGKYEFYMPGAGYRAVCKCPTLDYAKFTVAIRFKAEAYDPDRSNLLTGGTACRWFGMNRSEAGNLTITLNNQEFTREIKDAALRKGKWTVVACGVDLSNHRVLVYLNGKKVANIDLPKRFKLDVIDTAFKDEDKEWSFTNYSNGDVFHGMVDELLVYGRMLSPGEFAKILLRPKSTAGDNPEKGKPHKTSTKPMTSASTSGKAIEKPSGP
jgi:hypothetical protein